MSRILFLDDSPARLAWAKRTFGPGNDLTLVETAEAAIKALALADPWDGVYLDHDLGGETYVDSNRPDTGMEVVRWMVENRPVVERVIVHSMNTPAGNAMVQKLRDGGYDAYYVMFLRLAEPDAWTYQRAAL